MSLILRVFFVVLVVATFGCSKLDHAAPPMSGAPMAAAAAPQAPPAQQEAQVVGRKALLEIHATIDVDLDRPERAKAMVARLGDFAHTKGGYVAEARVGTDTGLTHMVLRIPAADLPALRVALAGEGSIVRETETATDVTDAIADLDARLRSAKMEEARILKLLEERSGTITDVLAAERALADVRQRIERLEAEQRVAQGRVDLATVDVSLHHPVPGAIDESAFARLGDAARDGVAGAKGVVIGLATVALRGGPTLLVFSALALAIMLAVRRVRRLARSS